MGGTVTNAGVKTFQNAEALLKNRRVKLNGSGKLVYADAGDYWIGTTLDNHDDTDEHCAVLLKNVGGTCEMTAAAAIATEAPVFGSDDGKIDDGAAGRPIGRALQAASGSGSIIEVLIDEGVGGSAVTDHTADATLTADDMGGLHTTIGAAGTVDLTLPSAALGLEAQFYVGAAQTLRVSPPAGEKISLPSTGVPGTAAKGIEANAVGETVRVKGNGVDTYMVIGSTGTWTAEA